MAFDTKPNLNNDKFEQFAGETLNLSGRTQIFGYLDIESGATFTMLGNKGSGKVLTSDANGVGTWQTISTSSGERVTKEITQTSHGFSVKDVVGYSGTTYNKPLADGNYNGEILGLVTKVIDANTFEITQSGYITGLTSLVTNTTYFLSDVTAGLLTSTEPTTDGHISKSVFFADSTTSGWVLPYAGYVISTGTTSITGAINGLSESSGIVKLGGALCENTTITDLNNYSLSFSGGTLKYCGDYSFLYADDFHIPYNIKTWTSQDVYISSEALKMIEPDNFLMREYIGKLFEAGTGIPIQKEVMRDKILTLFDYWGKETHGEKLEVRFGTEDEEKLIEILKDLFKLEDVRSLNDARWKVREWVKKQGFPIWAFKFAENINENTTKAIDAIFGLVQSIDRELTYEKIRDYLNAIEGVRYDLDILIDRENPEESFKKWLKSIEGVEISPEDIEEVIDYIKRNMQEEVASWTEDRVREKVKDWYTEKLKKSQAQLEKQIEELKQTKGSEIIAQDNKITVSQHTESHPFIPEGRIENIKKRIWGSSEKNVKEILIKLIDELKDKHPDIVETIEKYLEGA